MPGCMRDVRARRGPGSGPCHGLAVARRVTRTTVTFAPAPRRSPSMHLGVRPVPVERYALDGSAWLTDRARAPNLLRSRGVRRQGSVRWEGCGRKLPHEWRRRREGWSGSGRRFRRVTPRLRRRGHRCLPGGGGIGPDHDPACEHVDQHQPAEADIRATAAASIGRCWSSIGPGPGTSATAVAVVVLQTRQRMPAPRGQLPFPAPGIAHDPPVLTIRDRGH